MSVSATEESGASIADAVEEEEEEEDSEFIPPPELCLPKSMSHVRIEV